MIQHLFCANARMMFLKPEIGRLDNKMSAPQSEWSQTITSRPLLRVLYIVSCGSVVEHLGWWSHGHGLEFGYIFWVVFVSWLRNIILCFYFTQNLDNSWLIIMNNCQNSCQVSVNFPAFRFRFRLRSRDILHPLAKCNPVFKAQGYGQLSVVFETVNSIVPSSRLFHFIE